MKKNLTFLLAFCTSVLACGLTYAQEQELKPAQKILVIREGKQLRRTTVTIEAFLIDDVLDIKVETRMYAERPKIKDVYFVGPKIGRMRYKVKEEIPEVLTEDEPYSVTTMDGIIVFGNRTKEKKPKGTVTKERFKFKIPKDKIVSGKTYQIWVTVESKTRGGERGRKFIFKVENLAEIIAEQR